ncbi:DUF3306 domain-containing protein [Microvirga massiliensis]|uniref:DUF3306 domain-containing protein n=1 Tax=Microvirga massiliensis TaxID=1033741 RepID=UPI000699CF5C|nr:DUF3306 domain-containing protein [Microvirga massiliensis]
MSDDREDFLARWSRRKREANRAGTETPSGESRTTHPEPLRHGPDEEGSSGGAERTAPASVEPTLTEEELAALPKIEEISAQTDIAGFLRKGVPEALRNAALRRMWSVDPAIRDYVGDARDYAWDWNTPGGVPGNGPLLPGDDADGVLRTLFSNRPSQESERRITASPDESDQALPDESKVVEGLQTRSDTDAALQQNTRDEVDLPAGGSPESQASPAIAHGQPELHDDAAVRSEPAENRLAHSPRRRHGRARPV